MNKKLLALGIILVFLMVGFSGCNEKDSNNNKDWNKFVGTWEEDKELLPLSFTLFSDGAGSWAGRSITWEITEGKFTIFYSDGSLIYNYEFLNDNKTLKLDETTSGLKYTMIKQ